MKYLLIYFIAPLLLTLSLASCSSSSDVVSDRGIQKRKYRKGYFVVKSVQKPETETADIDNLEIDPTVKTIDMVRKTPGLQTNLVFASAIQKPITNVIIERNNSPIIEPNSKEADKNEYHKLASILNSHTPKFEMAHAQKSAVPMDDQELILFLILAILLPWLAMLLLYGFGKEFFISLLLWLLFILPGVIYAVIMVLRKLG